MHKLAFLVATTTLLAATATCAFDDLTAQIDAIVPLIAAGELEALGGPDTAADLVEGIDGRWFTLVNTIRNWDRTEDKAAYLAGRIESLCSDDWEVIVTLSATGPESFRVAQVSPSGEDMGTMEMVSMDPAGRRFTTTMSDEAIIALHNLEDATPGQQREAIDHFNEYTAAGADIWMPGPDVMVDHSQIGTEVWGRCP